MGKISKIAIPITLPISLLLMYGSLFGFQFIDNNRAFVIKAMSYTPDSQPQIKTQNGSDISISGGVNCLAEPDNYFRGWPFTTYYDVVGCGAESSPATIYPLGIVGNIILVGALSFGMYKLIGITRRSKI